MSLARQTRLSLGDPLRAPYPAGMNDVDPARLKRVTDAIEDPCDEGGYDMFCRDRAGQPCPEYAEHCHPPVYPCIDRLRHRVALNIVTENDRRRAARRQ